MNLFAVGQRVQWKWYGGVVDGVVVEFYTEPTIKKIKGKLIKRNGSEENPAYYVQSQAGNYALKLQSELMLPNNTIDEL